MAPAGNKVGSGWLARVTMQFLVGTDLERARRKMRYAGIAGLAAAGINFAVALMTFRVGNQEGVDPIGDVAFILVMLEAALLGLLAVGVIKRKRTAAAALLGYFILRAIVTYSVGIGSLTALPLQIIFVYLFFQGLRGALTYYYLTHPEYPTTAPTGGATASLRENGRQTEP